MILYLGQKYLSWYLTVVCMRGLGEGCCAPRNNHCPPLLVGSHLYLSGGFWERAGECPDVRCSVCNCCDSKSLVLFCGRTSPPGAHEVYVQNNKQMNKHKLLLLLRACFCRSVLAPVSEPRGLLPLSAGNLNPPSLIKRNSPSLFSKISHISSTYTFDLV